MKQNGLEETDTDLSQEIDNPRYLRSPLISPCILNNMKHNVQAGIYIYTYLSATESKLGILDLSLLVLSAACNHIATSVCTNRSKLHLSREQPTPPAPLEMCISAPSSPPGLCDIGAPKTHVARINFHVAAGREPEQVASWALTHCDEQCETSRRFLGTDERQRACKTPTLYAPGRMRCPALSTDSLIVWRTFILSSKSRSPLKPDAARCFRSFVMEAISAFFVSTRSFSFSACACFENAFDSLCFRLHAGHAGGLAEGAKTDCLNLPMTAVRSKPARRGR
jgi:hypothetical protein